MSKEFLTINLNFEGEESVLAPLLSADPPANSKYLPVPVRTFPENYRKAFKQVYKRLTGEETTDDLVVFNLMFRDGYPKLYGPSLCADPDGEIAIRWGRDKLIPLEITSKGPKLVGGDTAFEFAFSRVVYGQYEELCLELSFMGLEDFEEVIFYFQIRTLWDEENNQPFELNVQEAKQAFRPGENEQETEERKKLLINQLGVPKMGGGSGQPVLSSSDLPQDTLMTVTNIKPITTKKGETRYILTIAADESIPELSEGDVKVWAFTSRMKNLIQSGGTTPATLKFTKTVEQKGSKTITRYPMMQFKPTWPDNSKTINLKELFATSAN